MHARILYTCARSCPTEGRRARGNARFAREHDDLAPAVASATEARRGSLLQRPYLTRNRPDIHGWMMQMKLRTVPGRAVTWNLTGPPRPFGAITIESPGASKPAAPTLTSRIGGGPICGPPSLRPCDFPIAAQAAQFSICFSVCGTCEAFTSESVCGSGPLFVSVIVPPDLIVVEPGAKWK